MFLSQNVAHHFRRPVFVRSVIALAVLSGCQRIQDWTKAKASPSTTAPAQAKGAAVSEVLQPVSRAWQAPVDLAMSASAVCVRSATGAVACANLTDAQGPHFRPLNLLGEVGGFLANGLNLCVARGAETYCLSDAVWLPTNARSPDFGIFRRAFALDGAEHLGRINTDPARLRRDGSFLARNLSRGGEYGVDNVEPWIQAEASMNEEACGLTRDRKVVCYKAVEVSVKPTDDDSPPNKVSLTRIVPVALPARARTLALSDSYSCALLEDQRVYCWLPPMVGGSDQHLAAAGALPTYPKAHSPYDSTPIEPVPRVATPMALASPTVRLVSGENFVCALGRDRHVSCFGGNNWGQLGQVRPIAGSRQPLHVQNLGEVMQVAAAGGSVCAIAANGGVFCWGKLSGNRYQSNSSQFSRVPLRITDSDRGATAPERRICPSVMQVKLDPEDWARQLKLTKDPVVQAQLLEQMQMASAKVADSLAIEVPVLKRVSLEHSRNSPTLASTWLVRTDWAIGKSDTSTRSQLLVPVSPGTYCAVAPDELASIDREAIRRPCRSHPSLGKFDGPYRAHFITLTSEDHWALEVFGTDGRVDPLTQDEFHYEVTYYDQAGFDVRRVFNLELFGGTCAKADSESALGVSISRTFKLTSEMPRTILIEDCEPGASCTKRKAAFSNGDYDIEDAQETAPKGSGG